jgi:hypothetical protein
MREYALIDKFLGLWPSECDLTRWIKYWWNPKGDYEVQLNSKGFFTIILYNLEDKDIIFDNRPYFYNSVGLFLQLWIDRLSPEKEDFTMATVWIILYSFPHEFWLEEILMGIGNTVGRYVKSSEATKQRKYTSYARICVYTDISKYLPVQLPWNIKMKIGTKQSTMNTSPFDAENAMSMATSFEIAP